MAEELPRLAERGRERLGVHVNSARAVGQFAVKAGGHELKRRSAGLKRPPRRHRVDRRRRGPDATRPRPRSGPGCGPSRTRRSEAAGRHAADRATPPRRCTGRPRSTPTCPTSATLAIPGFDTLSASQVVQRLDGLSRSELVAVRAYETSTRGRRTILSRVDQLLDERS